MFAFLKRLRDDRRGNVLAIIAASMPLIIGGAGLATDTIQWTLWKRQLQRAADSAAIAGVYDREAAGGSTSTASAAVTHDLVLNLHTSNAMKTGFPTVSFPANSGSATNQVKVTVAIQKPLSFSSFFMASAPTITAVATAASIPAGGDACVQALENSASKTGITNSGNTTIYMPDCVFYSNSPSTNSASAGGSSSVTALAIAAVGGIQQSNNWHVTSYRPYSPALPDPFAGVAPDLNAMTCSASALTATTNFATLPAGTNCFASMSIGSNKSLTVPANFGPIYINGGSVDLKGTFTCVGCTIVLTNKNPASTTIGTFDSNAQATNSITAPTSGTFKGIAVYQDRRAVDCSGCNKINGGSSNPITGAMYFPKQELWYNGGGNVTATCTMFVARRITFTGNSGISNKFKSMKDCGLEGLPSSSSVKMVRLVA
ncbi:MAG: pilus assembly protein TadG-related protein [Sphingomicrobium sp.]